MAKLESLSAEDQKRLDAFLADYEVVCVKHGIKLISEGEAVHAINFDSLDDEISGYWGIKEIASDTLDRGGLG